MKVSASFQESSEYIHHPALRLHMKERTNLSSIQQLRPFDIEANIIICWPRMQACLAGFLMVRCESPWQQHFNKELP